MSDIFASVICCDDSVEAVVLDDKAVRDVLEKLARTHYQHSYINYGFRIAYTEYRSKHYWHTHRVKVLS